VRSRSLRRQRHLSEEGTRRCDVHHSCVSVGHCHSRRLIRHKQAGCSAGRSDTGFTTDRIPQYSASNSSVSLRPDRRPCGLVKNSPPPQRSVRQRSAAATILCLPPTFLRRASLDCIYYTQLVCYIGFRHHAAALFPRVSGIPGIPVTLYQTPILSASVSAHCVWAADRGRSRPGRLGRLRDSEAGGGRRLLGQGSDGSRLALENPAFVFRQSKPMSWPLLA